jgi:hypothetical protein
MFQSRRNGLALLIIRLALVAMMAVQTLRASPELESLLWPAPVLLLIVGALSAGVATTVTCCLYCVAEITLVLAARPLDTSALTLSIPVAVALAVLGPGAYSLDARIFGRRTIVLPPGDHR